jgi:hypothetical protein
MRSTLRIFAFSLGRSDWPSLLTTQRKLRDVAHRLSYYLPRLAKGSFMRALTFSILALMVLTACGSSDRPLRDLRSSSGGPDEFAVILSDPLILPSNLTALPQPTPGGSNRADPSPKADAIAALGGSAAAQSAGGIPANDAALVAQAGRYGVSPDIRSALAAEDAALRDRARIANVFNPLGRDRYFPAYRRQALDASAELARLQALGTSVPTVPAPIAADPGGRTPILDNFIIFRENCQFTTAGSPDGRMRYVCDDDVEDAEADPAQ